MTMDPNPISSKVLDNEIDSEAFSLSKNVSIPYISDN